LLSTKAGGGTSFWQKQKKNDSNESFAFDNKSEMHDYQKMMAKKNQTTLSIGEAPSRIQQ